MTPLEIPYKRKAVDPLECIRAGWELVKPRYWLFVGMSFIAFFVGSAVPFGILLGADDVRHLPDMLRATASRAD